MKKEIITHIVAAPAIHARWLNTLSMMENTGARKIMCNENELHVNEMILKHAAEEARHAYYLKKQISKLQLELEDYSNEFLIAPSASRHYLKQLDVFASRYLKRIHGLTGEKLKYGCYLLVTYAIEVRADQLYPVYQEVLDEVKSKVNVKSIIAEEAGHLEEMTSQLNIFSSNWKQDAEAIEEFENFLYDNWQAEIEEEIFQSV